MGTDPRDAEGHSDGLSDGEDLNTNRIDPLVEDTDDDGLIDRNEVNGHSTDRSMRPAMTTDCLTEKGPRFTMTTRTSPTPMVTDTAMVTT
jgi:hypothetical protein